MDVFCKTVSSVLSRLQWLHNPKIFCNRDVAIVYVLEEFSKLNTFQSQFDIRGPCIVIDSYNESQRAALFLRFIW